MTLVNIGPHVILHQKIQVPWAVDFVGRSKGVPAPCVPHTLLIVFLLPLCWALFFHSKIFAVTVVTPPRMMGHNVKHTATLNDCFTTLNKY